MTTGGEILLKVDELHAHYGKSHILDGVNLQVRRGEVCSLLGRNGSGRSTTLKSIMGLVRPTAGRVLFNGIDLANRQPYEVCRAGIGYVPEEREIFTNLSVDENLRMGEQKVTPGATSWAVSDMFGFFPRLKERRHTLAGNLSGGEQQMLTICRSLLGCPQLLLIDEPTEGLAPKIVAVVAEAILEIQRRGVSVILVEQKLTIALKISTHVSVMGHGRIVFDGAPKALMADAEVLNRWLAV